jgi:MFS transporter, DHA1 family, multidrug resistance protein
MSVSASAPAPTTPPDPSEQATIHVGEGPLSPRPASLGFVALLAALCTVGPFSIDTYLPAMKAVEDHFGASHAVAQQTLAAYLAGMAAMSLWHGALSDAWGRRPVVLGALAVYVVASVACVFAPTIEFLIGARLLQGLSGGAGIIIARAIIRDCFSMVEAQRVASTLTMIFSLAPALAPIVGGWLYAGFGWRSIFWFLLGIGVALVMAAWWLLPETLPPAYRRSLRPKPLALSYWQVFKRREFQFLAASAAFNFSGFFIYFIVSPQLVIDHLKMRETDFGWLFVPAILGTATGAFVSGRLAGKIPQERQVWLGYGLIALAAATALFAQLALMLAATPPPAAWRTALTISPIVLYGMGMSMITPVIQLMVMDLFPDRRGLVSSFQSFTQVSVSALTAGAVAPLVSHSLITIAGTMAAYSALGIIAWALYLATRRG